MLRALKWRKMTTPAPCKTAISWWQKLCYRYWCASRQQTLLSSCFICAAYVRPLLKSYKCIEVALSCEFVFSDCSIGILVVHYPCVFEELNLEFVLTELRYNTESICSSDLNPFALCVEWNPFDDDIVLSAQAQRLASFYSWGAAEQFEMSCAIIRVCC